MHDHIPINKTPKNINYPRLARRQGAIFSGVLNIIDEPAWIMLNRLRAHFEKKYLGKYHHAKRLFAIDLALVAMIIILAGLAVWAFFFRTTLADDFILTAESSPSELISGAHTTFTITYENRSEEIVYNAVLAIRLPPYFKLLRSFPQTFNEQTGTIPLGTLAPGTRGQAKINGVFWGPVGESSPLFTSLSLISQKTRQPTIKLVRTDIPIADSVLKMTLKIPERIVRGQAVPFIITFENTGPEPLTDLFFESSWPAGSSIIESTPPHEQNRWHIGTLPAGTSGEIRGAGRPNINADEQKTSLGFVSRLMIGKRILPQNYFSAEAKVIPTPLAISGVTESKIVKPGSALTIHLTAQNIGAAPLDDVMLGVFAEGPFITDLPQPIAMGALTPGGSTTTDVVVETQHLPEISNDTNHETRKELTLNIFPTVSATLQDGIPLPIEIRGDMVSLNAETPFNLTSVAKYWMPEGDQIGRGPMPPIADETTKYWIFWQIHPTTNDLTDVIIQTTLPDYIEWTGRTSVMIGNPIDWDENRRTVTWSIDALPATLANDTIVAGRFEIGFTPTTDQIGTNPIILNSVSATAHDTFVQTTVQDVSPPLTTELWSDLRALGRSKVQP